MSLYTFLTEMYSPLLLLTLPLFYSTQGNPVNRESPFKEPITVTSNGINVTYDVSNRKYLLSNFR